MDADVRPLQVDGSEAMDLMIGGRSVRFALCAANELFAPTLEEVHGARMRVAAIEAARATGEVLMVVDGKLVEELHIQEAARVLAMDAALRKAD